MIIALDYGTRRVGVAVSNDTETIALTDKAIHYQKEEQLINSLKEIIKKFSPRLIVMGLPLGNSDKPTLMSEKVKKFSLILKKEFNLEVVFWNEVMTSLAASRFVKKDKSGKLDSESARIILQEYLDFKI